MARLYFLMAWILILPGLSFSQQVAPLPIFVDRELEIPFIRQDGKVAFTLPAGDRPIWKQYTKGSVYMLLNGAQPMNVFFDGICVVSAKSGGIYWIDQQGKKIKDFGKTYSFIGPFQEGFALARRTLEGQYASELIFLNSAGENAFGTRTFWEAEPFAEGLAPVQLEEGGEWGYLDREGKLAVQVAGKNSSEIAALYPFSEGMARVALHIPGEPYDKTSLFIDRQGQVVFAVKDLFPNRSEDRIGSFREGMVDIGLVRVKGRMYDLAFVDKQGSLKKRYANAGQHAAFHNGRGYYKGITQNDDYSTTSKYFWLSATGPKTDILPIDGRKVTKVLEITDSLIAVETFEREGWKEGTALLRTRDLQPVFFTEKQFCGFSDQYILFRDKNTKSYTLQTVEGAYVWGSPVGDNYFQSLEQALPHKLEVKRYLLTEATDLEGGIEALKNLEYLEIRNLQISSLPTRLTALFQLKKLQLRDLPQLTTLPAELSQLNQLETLEIAGCPRLTEGLESLIEQAPGLKKVRLTDIELSAGFEARIKELRPDLELEADFSLGPVQIESLDGGR